MKSICTLKLQYLVVAKSRSLSSLVDCLACLESLLTRKSSTITLLVIVIFDRYHVIIMLSLPHVRVIEVVLLSINNKVDTCHLFLCYCYNYMSCVSHSSPYSCIVPNKVLYYIIACLHNNIIILSREIAIQIGMLYTSSRA